MSRKGNQEVNSLVVNGGKSLLTNSTHQSSDLRVYGSAIIDDAIITDLKVVNVTVLGSISGSSSSPEYFFTPPDYDLLAWAFDPMIGNGNLLNTDLSGTLLITKIICPVDIAVGNIVMYYANNSETVTSGFVGLYQNNILIGTTADMTSIWTTPPVSNHLEMPLIGGPFVVSAGYVYVGIIINSSDGTLPAFGLKQSGLNNFGLTGTNIRFGTADTSITTLPGTLGTVSTGSHGLWFALS
jgi:hypothetical protein